MTRKKLVWICIVTTWLRRILLLLIPSMNMKVTTFNGLSFSRLNSVLLKEPFLHEGPALREWYISNKNDVDDLLSMMAYKDKDMLLRKPATADIMPIMNAMATLETMKNAWISGKLKLIPGQDKYWYMACKNCHRALKPGHEIKQPCSSCDEENPISISVRGYHVGCLRSSGWCDLKEIHHDKWLCCNEFHVIYAALQNFILNGTEECFALIVAKSGSDLIPIMVYGDGDEKGKKKAMEEITDASSEYGFFQVVNHGVPLNLIQRALELLKQFFDCPSDVKLKSSPRKGVIPPAGYFKTPDHSIERHEHFLITSPSMGKNVYPDSHPELREVLDEIFPCFTKLAVLLERIISIWLGLKADFLKEYNNDRSCDFFLGLHYPPAIGFESNGKSAHEDGNCLSFIVQDDVEGLQVLNNGQWILVPPANGALVVNIGDVLQERRSLDLVISLDT